MVAPLADKDPQYDEWKWSFEEIKKSLSRLMTVYEELGGGYDLQEIKRVINHSQQ